MADNKICESGKLLCGIRFSDLSCIYEADTYNTLLEAYMISSGEFIACNAIVPSMMLLLLWLLLACFVFLSFGVKLYSHHFP